MTRDGWKKKKKATVAMLHRQVMKVKSFLALFSEIFMLISKASQTLPGNSLYLVDTYSGKFIQKLYFKL